MARPFEPASPEFLKRLVPMFPLAIVAADAEHRISFCNPAFERLFYHRTEDVLGKDLRTLLGIPGSGEMASAVYFLSRAETVRVAIRARRKDQTIVDVEFHGVPDVTNGTYNGYCAAFLDLTERSRTEHALEVSETKLSRAFRASPTAVALSTAKEHRLIDVNDTWARLTGYRREEAVGRTLVELGLVDPADFQRIGQQLAAQGGSVRDVECQLRTRDGTTIIGSVSAEEFDVDGEALRIVMTADITALKTAQDTLSQVSQTLIDAQEKERLRIANTLHDDVGQRLAAWQMAIDRLARDSRHTPAGAIDGLDDLRTQATGIATTIQALSRELHSPALGLLSVDKALSELCSDIAMRMNMSVDFRSRRVPGSVPTEASICLFRVLQEGLTDAARHSGTRRARVTLWGTPTAIHLRIRDLGRGSPVDNRTPVPGPRLGLITMRERVAMVKGEVSMTAPPQGGARIDVRIPLARARTASVVR